MKKELLATILLAVTEIAEVEAQEVDRNLYKDIRGGKKVLPGN